VSRPTFRSWVADGLIAKVALPFGIHRNLYRLADLEALADEMATSSTRRDGWGDP
jgi:hypothetical protein